MRAPGRMLGAIVITLVFGAIAVVLWLGGQDVLAGRITARRAVRLRVLCHGRRQRGRWPQRRVRRPAARGRRHRAAVRAAGRPGRDRGTGRADARCRPTAPARCASSRSASPIPSHPERLVLRRLDLDGAARRDGGAGRAIRRRQDQRVPAPDALLRPDRGRILFDGVPITELEPERPTARGSVSCRRSR